MNEPKEDKEQVTNALNGLKREKQIRCKHCKGTFKSIRILNSHMNSKHATKKKKENKPKNKDIDNVGDQTKKIDKANL